MSNRSSRRRFLHTSAAVAAGFAGLRTLVHSVPTRASEKAEAPEFGYGELISDPQGLLDLPRGFQYQIISESGKPMDDGLLMPGAPDGMAALPGPYGLTVVVRNHELDSTDTGPWGEDRKLFANVAHSQVYDAGQGQTPAAGGTSTFVFDTRRQQKLREFMSLAGTIRNCAGGPTPWKSWITCEECNYRSGPADTNKAFITEKDHGYNFEVPVTARMELAEPVPLVDMGRFNHEAVAVDPATGIVYQTEDRDDSCIYRFIPNQSGNLRAGGRLQALVLRDKKSWDVRNWSEDAPVRVGEKLAVDWIDMDHVTSPEDDLRARGFAAGAARFARGEGIWYGRGEFYFACTSGGKAKLGQIWRYVPGGADENSGEAGGSLELFIEPNDGQLVENADNLTVSPWGDLIVCEDRSGQVVRLVGVTPQGRCYPFALNHLRSEFAGATFSPDGSTLFVNIQTAGLTVAITGPWRQEA